MTAPVSLRDLRVRRGGRVLIEDGVLDLAAGEVVHLAGANGAGKTSVLRVLAGLDRAEAGQLRAPVQRAFVPEGVVLAAGLSVGGWFDAMRRLRKAPPVDWGAQLEGAGLPAETLAAGLRSLSKGMTQRVALIEALESPTALLLLDEPFSGLDAPGREWLRERIDGRAARGDVVVLTDHSRRSEGAFSAQTRVTITERRLRRQPLPADAATPSNRHRQPRTRRSPSPARSRRGGQRRDAAPAPGGRPPHRAGRPRMTAGVRYFALTAARARAPLFPLAAFILALIGTWAEPENLVGSSWALTSLLACGLSTWGTLAVLRSEPAAQADMATVALGGPARRLRAQALLIALQAMVLATAFVAYPLILDRVVTSPVFNRPVEVGDAAGAWTTILLSAVLGGAIAILSSPPGRARPAVSGAAAFVILLALVPLGSAPAHLGGPLAAARALTNAAPGHLGADEATAWGSTALLTAIAIGAGRRAATGSWRQAHDPSAARSWPHR